MVTRPRLKNVRESHPEDFGHFDSDVTAHWLPDGRCMALVAPHVFRQVGIAQPWVAPIGSVTDGASIPKVFWSVVGGPYEGGYRDAAVNHDYECRTQTRAWRSVHRMFYAGMRAKEVEPWLAALMYFAVYFFGPRWPAADAGRRKKFAEGDIPRFIALARRRRAITLEDIENLSQESLRSAVHAKPRVLTRQPELSDTRLIKPVRRRRVPGVVTPPA